MSEETKAKFNPYSIAAICLIAGVALFALYQLVI